MYPEIDIPNIRLIPLDHLTYGSTINLKLCSYSTVAVLWCVAVPELPSLHQLPQCGTAAKLSALC